MPSFGINEIDGLIRYTGEHVQAAARRGVLSAAFRIMRDIVVSIDALPERERPVDQGAYLAAWRVEPTPEGADVYNDAPHAPVIEYGGRASIGGGGWQVGRRMIEALSEWVVRKGLVGQGRGSHQARALEDEAQSMAWAIAKGMMKRGMFNQGSHPRADPRGGLRLMERQVANVARVVVEEIAAELRDALG